MMKYFYFSLNISYHDYLSYYSGHASSILVVTENGLKLQLPAIHFRPFLHQLGLKGRYRLTTDDHHKFICLEAI